MTAIDAARIALDGIGHLLKDRLFSVPKYQRSFKWEQTNGKALFQDIANAHASGRDEYFLGSVVCIRSGDRLEIVDGQQRIATVSILIAALRDFLLEQKDDQRASDIERDFLLRRERRSQEVSPRLILNDADHDYFLKRVLYRKEHRPANLKPARESHKRIDAIATAAREHVDAAFVQHKNLERLLDLLDFLESNTRVILFSLQEPQHAFIVFETLNDRGIDLAVADLLKNYLFLRSENRIDEAQGSWMRMIGALETTQRDDTITDFIRYLWVSENGPTRERDLYTAMKTHITSKQKAIDFVVKLEGGATDYAAILNPMHARWGDFGEKAKGHISLILMFKMSQIRPLLLAVMKNFKPKEVQKTLRLMVAWCVRFLVVGGHGAGVLEEAYGTTAKAVSKGDIASAAALATHMAAYVPSDTAFQNAFRVAVVSRPYLARYYLRALEQAVRKESEPQLVPNPDEEAINLEHVLPQSPGTGWKLSKEEMEAYCHRIGNLVLLQRTPNSRLGNKPFAEKKKVLSASEYKTTKQVGAESAWAPKQIEERQDKLAQIAVTVWAIN